jgi:hypothetical protein
LTGAQCVFICQSSNPIKIFRAFSCFSWLKNPLAFSSCPACEFLTVDFGIMPYIDGECRMEKGVLDGGGQRVGSSDLEDFFCRELLIFFRFDYDGGDL